VWSPSRAHCESFVRDAAATGRTVTISADASSAVNGADIVVLATSSKTPVLASIDVNPGTHICAVGACRPDQREMPSDLVARARMFIDSRAGAFKEAGDVLLAIADGSVTADHVAGELGELVLGRVAGRQTMEDVTVFKSLGMAIEDVVAAQLVLDRAASQGIGASFSLS